MVIFQTIDMQILIEIRNELEIRKTKRLRLIIDKTIIKDQYPNRYPKDNNILFVIFCNLTLIIDYLSR